MLRSREDLLHYERENDTEASEPKKREYKARSYKRTFEGCTQYAIPKKNGKYKYIILYTEPYYCLDVDDRKCRVRKFLYTGGLVVCILLFLGCAVWGRSSTSWYVALPQAVLIVFLVLAVYADGHYLIAKRLMTANSYRCSSQRLISASLGSAITFGVAALMSLVWLMLNFSYVRVLDVSCIFAYAICALLMLSVYRTEKDAEYRRVKNETEPPEGAILLGKI